MYPSTKQHAVFDLHHSSAIVVDPPPSSTKKHVPPHPLQHKHGLRFQKGNRNVQEKPTQSRNSPHQKMWQSKLNVTRGGRGPGQGHNTHTCGCRGGHSFGIGQGWGSHSGRGSRSPHANAVPTTTIPKTQTKNNKHDHTSTDDNTEENKDQAEDINKNDKVHKNHDDIKRQRQYWQWYWQQ